jgi:hypothetical protein
MFNFFPFHKFNCDEINKLLEDPELKVEELLLDKNFMNGIWNPDSKINDLYSYSD